MDAISTSRLAMVQNWASKYGLDPVLVCSVCEQESEWCQWLNRYEPSFEQSPIYGPVVKTEAASFVQKATFGVSLATEIKNRCSSFGLMQSLGQTAREHNFIGPMLQLCDTATGLDIGCAILKSKLNLANGDIVAGLQHYNGGANPLYASQVQARMVKYQS